MAKIWEDDNQTSDYNRFESASEKIDAQLEEGQTRGFGPNITEIVGICSTCANYKYVLNDVHQIIFSRCQAFDVSLGRYKVSFCNSHSPRGQLSLREMYELAILIDPNNKTNVKVKGFGS